jgi:hypothetical protein
MMMSFICSCRNNNQPTDIYPLGTFHRGLKKAHVMMLPSSALWYYDDFPPPLVDVVVREALHRSTTLSECPFIPMTDTDVTFLPNYNKMDLARLYVMILTSPPSLPRSRLWTGLGVRWPSQSHPVTQGLPVFESLPFNSLCVPGYTNLTTDIPNLLDYNQLDLARSHASILTFPCLASHLRQGRVASVPPAPHPPIKGLPIPKSFPTIPSSQVVVHVVPLHYV